ncbi:MAG: metallophosphoesterase [Bacteroidota bacterium]
MPHVKFIHTADLHLDTPFKGLSQINKQLALKIKDATLKAFESIIDKCISERVDFLLIAGDIFDRESQSLGSQIKFVEQLQRPYKKRNSHLFHLWQS